MSHCEQIPSCFSFPQVIGQDSQSSPVGFLPGFVQSADGWLLLGVEHDKLILIRALALASLHVEVPDGGEDSSLHLLRAIYHAQMMDLHLDNAKKHMHDNSLGTLAWCLWSLDRLNACMNGRPVMISGRDIGVTTRSSCGQQNSEGFRIWLRIADMVDHVIALYRPSVDTSFTGGEDDFPRFGEIVRDCEFLGLLLNIIGMCCVSSSHVSLLI